jgi:hypothetical protein
MKKNSILEKNLKTVSDDFKNVNKPGIVVYHCNPSTWELQQGDHSSIQVDPISKKKK